jgi:WD40 repeat protein
MKTTMILSLISLLYGSLLSSTQPMYGLGGVGGYVKYYRLSDGEIIGDFHPDADVNSVKISPDGEYTLIANGGYVKYCHLPEGTVLMKVPHGSIVYSVDISKDGLYALSGCYQRTMKYWRISDGECLSTMTHEGWAVVSVSFSPDGQYALEAGGTDCGYWRLSDGTLLKVFSGHTGKVNSAVISPDGLYALSGSNDRTIKLFDINTGQCIKTLTGHTDVVYSVCFSPDSKYALSGSGYYDQTLKYWNLSTGECVRTFTGHGNSIWGVDISDNGGYALSGSDDNSLRYWRISDGTCLRIIHSGNATRSVSFSPLEETGFKKTQSSLKQLPQGIVSASPNPFSNRLKVSLPSSGAVYTLTGRLIMKLDKGDHDIDTSNWKEGVYILKAGEETKKIVKIENIFLLFLL